MNLDLDISINSLAINEIAPTVDYQVSLDFGKVLTGRGIKDIVFHRTLDNGDNEYKIIYTDNTVSYFIAPKGSIGTSGTDGITPHIQNGYWYIGLVNTGVIAQGPTGISIDRIEKTDTIGNVDIYTIYFTDGTTYLIDVTNGKDGITTKVRLNGNDYTQQDGVVTLPNVVLPEAGKGLSENNYTAADKLKLANIASGAEVNVQSDWSINDANNDAYIKNKPDVYRIVSTHDLSPTSHQDIRSKLEHVLSDADNAKNIGLPIFDTDRYVLTFKANDGTTMVVDLPIEELAANLEYDPVDRVLILYSKSGEIVRIPIEDLIQEYYGSDGLEIQVTIGSGNIINATLKDGTITYNKLTKDIIDRIDSKISESYVDTKYETKNANIQLHITDKANPHSTTKSQVGLGNVDNTSDLNKPISTVQQSVNTALNNQITQVDNKVTYITTDLADLTNQVNNNIKPDIVNIKVDVVDLVTNKVDKIDGKGLSTNDYNDYEKHKANSVSEILWFYTSIDDPTVLEANVNYTDRNTLDDGIVRPCMIMSKGKVNRVKIIFNHENIEYYDVDESYFDMYVPYSDYVCGFMINVGMAKFVLSGSLPATQEDIDSNLDILKYVNPSQLNNKLTAGLSTKANTNLSNVGNQDFYTKGIASGLTGVIPEIQSTVEVYLTGYDAANDVYILSNNKPATQYSFNWNVSTTNSTKRFRYTYTEDGVISALSRFKFVLMANSMETNRTYNFQGIVYARINGVPNILGYNSYANLFPISNPRVEIPLENNALQANLNRKTGDYIEIELSLIKSGGSSDVVTITSDANNPTKFVRNGGDIGSNNVLDFNGTNTATQSQRNREYEEKQDKPTQLINHGLVGTVATISRIDNNVLYIYGAPITVLNIMASALGQFGIAHISFTAGATILINYGASGIVAFNSDIPPVSGKNHEISVYGNSAILNVSR